MTYVMAVEPEAHYGDDVPAAWSYVSRITLHPPGAGPDRQ